MSGILKFTGNSFLLVTTVIFLFSCSNNSKNNLTVFKVLDASLSNSNRIINQSNEDIYRAIEEKLNDPSTNAKAAIWQPRAMQIKKLSQEIVKYIDSLKTALKKEAGLSERNLFDEEDINAVNRLFIKKAKGEELYTKLIKYKQGIFAIDLLISNTFEKIITITTNDVTEKADVEKIFTKSVFTEIPTVAALAMLTKFQNNIRIAENKTILFCLEYTHSHDIIEDFTSFSAIVGQNFKYLRAGDEVEIMAGIGEFTMRNKPEIIIDGKNIPINDEHVAISKFKAVGKPGKHFVPVQITYTDMDGKKQTIRKTVEYTIAKE
jgi:gliding motility-associated protein GldM